MAPYMNFTFSIGHIQRISQLREYSPKTCLTISPCVVVSHGFSVGHSPPSCSSSSSTCTSRACPSAFSASMGLGGVRSLRIALGTAATGRRQTGSPFFGAPGKSLSKRHSLRPVEHRESCCLLTEITSHAGSLRAQGPNPGRTRHRIGGARPCSPCGMIRRSLLPIHT